jgi:hypothetical protein
MRCVQKSNAIFTKDNIRQVIYRTYWKAKVLAVKQEILFVKEVFLNLKVVATYTCMLALI